jgi:hypothetical protein
VEENLAIDNLAGAVDDLQNGAGSDTLAAAAFAHHAQCFTTPDRIARTIHCFHDTFGSEKMQLQV